jgi:Ca2+-binding RTX toxin-like protein
VNLTTRTRSAAATLVVAALASVLAGSALAGNISGTPKNDVLRGTSAADKISGGKGNDKLYGLAGGDRLDGGPGADQLTGGPGADVLRCGPGRDIAVADALDKVASDCETITGLPKPDLLVSDVSGEEGNSGTKAMEFSVVLAKASPLEVTVAFSTRDGSARAGSDYAAASGRLTFGPGETQKTVSVAVMGDTEVEENETFSVALTDPVNAKLGHGTATGTITNEDVPKPKAGHYSGTTSQGRAISYDLNPELTAVSGLVVYLDVSCPSVGLTMPNERLEFPTLLVSPDWKFGITDTYSDSDGSITVTFSGTLGIAAASTGSFRLDLSVNTPYGAVSCSSSDVSWTAQPPA